MGHIPIRKSKMAKREELPKDLVVFAESMYKVYGGLSRAYGVWTPVGEKSASGKAQGRAKTELAPYTASLWVDHLSGIKGLGVIPIQDNNDCVWGVLDIDTYDLNYEKVEKEIRDNNLPIALVRSKSGGLHLTMFFTKPISCKKVQLKLSEVSVLLGFGGCEIFPKQTHLANNRDVGNWLNMPYYNGYAEQSERYCILNGEPLSLLQFLTLVEQIRITPEQLDALEVMLPDDFNDGPPCLQILSVKGIPEGNRNNALFAMGVYARKKHPGTWEVEVDKLNQRYLDPPLPTREVASLLKSLAAKDYTYPCNKPPIEQFCNKKACRSRQYGIGTLDEVFNISLGSLIKVATEPPVWILDIEGTRVSLETDDLMNQERFRRMCVSSINKLPSLVPKKDWETILREKLSNVELVEAPKESRIADRIHQFVKIFVTVTPRAKEKGEIQLGRPFFDYIEESCMFRGNDFIKFLELQGIRSVEPRKIWVSLRGVGCTHKQINAKGSNFQVWTMPIAAVEDINIDGVAYKVPDTADIKESF